VRLNNVTEPLEQYMWSLRYIDAPVTRFYDANTDGDWTDAGDHVDLYTTDANMNVTAVLDGTDASVDERYVYDAYGTPTAKDGSWGTADVSWGDSKKNPIRFAGYFWDSETGLCHVRNRMYHPAAGRWLQRDPVDYGYGMALAEYVTSSPSSWVDPAGLYRHQVHDSYTIEDIWNKHQVSWHLFAEWHSEWKEEVLVVYGDTFLAPDATVTRGLGYSGMKVLGYKWSDPAVYRKKLEGEGKYKGCPQQCKYRYGVLAFQKESDAQVAIDVGAILKQIITLPGTTHTDGVTTKTEGEVTITETLKITIKPPGGSGMVIMRYEYCADGSATYEIIYSNYNGYAGKKAGITGNLDAKDPLAPQNLPSQPGTIPDKPPGPSKPGTPAPSPTPTPVPAPTPPPTYNV